MLTDHYSRILFKQEIVIARIELVVRPCHPYIPLIIRMTALFHIVTLSIVECLFIIQNGHLFPNLPAVFNRHFGLEERDFHYRALFGLVISCNSRCGVGAACRLNCPGFHARHGWDALGFLCSVVILSQLLR